ncbi:hypothetical protein TNCV_2547621 [Trichonephila clavipes]|nr:hypothetical protein TNCV_2547621 [Trichonephila clavipes]
MPLDRWCQIEAHEIHRVPHTVHAAYIYKWLYLLLHTNSRPMVQQSATLTTIPEGCKDLHGVRCEVQGGVMSIWMTNALFRHSIGCEDYSTVEESKPFVSPKRNCDFFYRSFITEANKHAGKSLEEKYGLMLL